MDLHYAPAVAFVFLWCTTVVVVLFAFVAAYRLVRRLAGVDPEQRTDTFLGLAVGSALCWPVFPWLGQTVSTLAMHLARWLPSEMTPAFQTSYDVCSTTDVPAKCVNSVLLQFADHWSQTTANVIRRLAADVPYGWVVAFLVFVVLTTQILHAVRETDPQRRPPLLRWLAGTTRTRRLDTILVITLILAFYLSVAAIAAIPALTDDRAVPAEATTEKLASQLTMKAGALESLVGEDPFATLEKRIAALQAAAAPGPVTVAGASIEPGEAPPSEPGTKPEPTVDATVLAELTEIVASMKRARERAVDALAEKHKAVASGIELRGKEAATVYEMNVNRAGYLERNNHFTQLLRWYRQTNESALAGLGACSSSVQFADRQAAAWVGNVQWLIGRGSLGPQRTDALLGVGAQQTRAAYYDAAPPCFTTVTFENAPSRPQLGLGLGPFRLLAAWLLGPESLSLALIVGMIGFGLLGSAVSTFVREKRESRHNADEPLVADLAGVILRGVCAAIVVFLAVKGGLTVFSGGEGEPDPYVLLLTCLVGAVFSERVWAWARERIATPPPSPDEKKHEPEGGPQNTGKPGDGTGDADTPPEPSVPVPAPAPV